MKMTYIEFKNLVYDLCLDRASGMMRAFPENDVKMWLNGLEQETMIRKTYDDLTLPERYQKKILKLRPEEREHALECYRNGAYFRSEAGGLAYAFSMMF